MEKIATDFQQLRPVVGDSTDGEAVKVLGPHAQDAAGHGRPAVTRSWLGGCRLRVAGGTSEVIRGFFPAVMLR
jgi:hypothetical protein